VRVLVAEKPKVGRELAGILGVVQSADGYIECRNDTCVTWCRGHLLGQARPEAYVSGERVEARDLPVIPERWKLEARDGDARKQLGIIKGLLARAEEVIHAGDADREGQLLVDQVLYALRWSGRTQRLWLSSLDDKSIRKALGKLRPNAEYRNLFDAALGRQRADWLIGFNASIAYSRNLQSRGIGGAWSIGRVQTPTLALIVDREREIERFTSRQHFTVRAELKTSNKEAILSQWQIPEDLLIDGLLLDREPAAALAARLPGEGAVVEKFIRKEHEREAPMPYTLSKLKQVANRRFGLSGQATLDAAQELYEAKAATYPRTDCPYLPDEQHGDGETILGELGALASADVDPTRKHAAWNTKKVEAHHAIIPTGAPVPGSCSRAAQQVFTLIRDAYVRLFMPPERYETREAIFAFSDGERFRAHSRFTLKPGWTAIAGAEDEPPEEDGKEEATRLPDLEAGQHVVCAGAEVLAKETKPPRYYTDGTLEGAMVGIHKLITDAKMKARLRETSGLGTEATRAAIIETLIARGYIHRNKKQLRPSERGCALIDTLRKVLPELPDPVETALQEDALADVAAGKASITEFLSKSAAHAGEVARVLTAGSLTEQEAVMHRCPGCEGDRCAALTSKGGWAYHRCADCGQMFIDNGGRPGRRWEPKAPSGVRETGKPVRRARAGSARAAGARTRPASEGRAHRGPKATSSAKPRFAGSGPTCPACQCATGEATTRNDRLYWRCPSCSGAWWPDRDNARALGPQWPPRP